MTKFEQHKNIITDLITATFTLKYDEKVRSKFDKTINIIPNYS